MVGNTEVFVWIITGLMPIDVINSALIDCYWKHFGACDGKSPFFVTVVDCSSFRYGNIEDMILEVRVVTGRGLAWQHSDRPPKGRCKRVQVKICG